MNAAVSFKLLNITQQFIVDKQKATEFVQLIEATIEEKFEDKTTILATKTDIANLRTELKETKVDMIKWHVALFVMLTLMIVGLYFK